MSHKGVRHDPLADIQLIRDNLNDRYQRGFPIIKELLQNAEDAHATRVEIGLCDGFADASHPLLATPGIFVINDAPFAAEDAEAIGGFGLSYKGGEKQSIGKFGLGIKSLFHLCEAFFYIASPDTEEDKNAESIKYSRNDILNPWSSEDDRYQIYPEWDRFSLSDQKLIQQRLNFLLKTPNWFCLWIPIRSQLHGLKEKPIMSSFLEDYQPPESILFENNTGENVAAILPLLRSVNLCRGWIIRENQKEMLFSAEVQNQSTRCSYEGGAIQPKIFKTQSLAGEVQLTRKEQNSSVNKIEFWGKEKLIEDDVFAKLVKSEHWPYTSSKNAETRLSEQKPEKADPHCAVILTRSLADRDASYLTINWSVFLPLGSQQQEIPLSLKMQVRIFLHGYFFLDAGRDHIEDTDFQIDNANVKNDTEIRKYWNANLAQKGTLQLLIPLFSSIAQNGRFNESEICDLTKGLMRSKIYIQHEKWICAECSWICCLNSTNKSWSSIRSNQVFYEVPYPGEEHEILANRLFGNVVEKACITFQDYPRLSTAEASPWPEDLLLEVLMRLPWKIFFDNPMGIKYFASFLSKSDVSVSLNNEKMNKVLHEIIRRVINKIGFTSLNQDSMRSNFIRILERIPSNKRVVLTKKGSHRIQESLLESITEDSRTELLILPESFSDVRALAGRKISPLDAVQTLQVINDLPLPKEVSESFWREHLDIVTALLKACEDERKDVIDNCSHLKLIPAEELINGRTELYSISQIIEKAEKSLLFKSGKVLAKALQDSLDLESFLLINGSEPEMLFDGRSIPECNLDTCRKILTTKPRLKSSPCRIELLKRMLDSESLGENKQVIRYLLHGKSEWFEDEKLLLAVRSHGDSDICTRLASQLKRLDEEAWTFVDPSLTDLINPRQKGILGISDLDLKAIDLHLRSSGIAEQIDCSNFTLEDRRILLRNLSSGVICRLKMHERSGDGELVSISSGCYWYTEFELEPKLLEKIVLLKKDTDRVIATIQEEIAPNLNPQHAIEIAVTQDEPHCYWQTIIRGIKDIGPHIPAQITGLLRDRPWIPGLDGATTPDAILHIGGADEQVRSALSKLTDIRLISILDLPEAFQAANSAIGKLVGAQLIPHKLVALCKLGNALAKDDQETFLLGLDAGLFDFELSKYLDVFHGAEPDIMPVASLIETLLSNFDEKDCRNSFVTELSILITNTDRIKRIFNHLVRRSQELPQLRDFVKDLHCRYLEAAVRRGVINDILPEIELLNERGRWKPSAELCINAVGVSSEHLLWARHYDIISKYVATAQVGEEQISDESDSSPSSYNIEDLELSLNESAEKLREYFNKWQGLVEPEVIGGFLSVLGDWPEVAKLTDEYLGHRSREGTRDGMGWKPLPEFVKGTILRVSGGGQSIHQIMANTKFLVQITNSNTCLVRNILGQEFSAKTSERVNCIVLPTRPSNKWRGQGKVIYVLSLRDINPGEISQDYGLTELLQSSAVAILRDVYCQNQPVLDKLWEDLAQSEQLDIRIAQGLILESSFFYLRQLRLQGNTGVRDLLKRLDSNRLRQEELNKSNQSEENIRLGIQKTLKEKEGLKSELEKLIREDSTIQQEILSAVRGKMDDFQYSDKSLPFEIFQNAEDAVAELRDIEGYPDDEPYYRRSFVIKIEQTRLIFAHWGRTINYAPVGTPENNRQDYQRDLEKMLVMCSSDKYISSDKLCITGKFGLGFKSVFLVSRCPKVLSGRLAFCVLGGMFPAELQSEDISILKQSLSTLNGDSETGTLIEAEQDKDFLKERSLNDILNQFEQLVPYMLVFAKQINRCRICKEGERDQYFNWHAKPLLNKLDSWTLETGTIPLSNSEQAIDVFVLRGDHGDIMMGLGENGFEELPNYVPTIWALTPTNTLPPIGLAINGRFDLDVGRNQLADPSDVNSSIATSLSKDFGQALTALYTSWRENPVSVCRDLFGETSLSVMDEHDFWNSLWVLVSRASKKVNDREQSGQLVRECLWGSDNTGMKQFIRTSNVVPTGLVGPYRVLVNINDIKYAAAEALVDLSIFDKIARLQDLNAIYPPGTIVSSAIASDLRVFANTKLTDLTLTDVIEQELPDDFCITPENASTLGVILSRDFLKQLTEISKDAKSDHNNLCEMLSKTYFRDSNGDWRLCTELLVSHGTEHRQQEERLRAAFAPKDRILNTEYEGALEFFLTCRPEMRASAKQLVEWMLYADTVVQKKAALRYFVNGNLSREVGDCLKQMNIYDSWLLNLSANSELFNDFNEHERRIIAGVLEKRDYAEHKESEVIAKPDLDPQEILYRIHKWWCEYQHKGIRDYESWIYHQSNPPSLEKDLSLIKTDMGTRKNWMVLLLSGAMHTMGRTRLEQNRGFIDLCERKGWLDIFSAPDLKSEEWLGVMHQFLEEKTQEIEYFHWMGQFVSIYQFAHWLPQYVNAFLSVDRLSADSDFDLTKITQLRTSSMFQQASGFDAPPISRTLGIGASFVLRELVRLNHVRRDDKRLWKCCFVPSHRVKRLLFAITGDPKLDDNNNGRPWELSYVIHELLQGFLSDKAHFEYAFDIPLLLLSDNRYEGIRTELLEFKPILDPIEDSDDI